MCYHFIAFNFFAHHFYVNLVAYLIHFRSRRDSVFVSLSKLTTGHPKDINVSSSLYMKLNLVIHPVFVAKCVV